MRNSDLVVPRIRTFGNLKNKGPLKSIHTRLCRLVGQAIADFSMVDEGDRIMVCVSGGKDSYGLLDILLALQKKAPIRFDLIAVNLDQKQPGFPGEVLPKYLAALGVEFHIEEQDTYSVVKELIPEGKTMCSLCSRLRRGVLYRLADQLGVTKIALGHHRNDLVETLFLNMFLKGRFASMPPKLLSDDGRHVVIRPLAYVDEADLASYAELKTFPIIPCNLCGSQDNLKRQDMKRLIQHLDQQFPGCVENILSSMGRVKPHRLMDSTLFDFVQMQSVVPGTQENLQFGEEAV
ncbi:tRNA 2-thiocytidine(32) synthetase TtcA [Candidatus Nitronereus thalassa]|uniref:tRNA 2-thiocytidine(32) synthetase TtcA n=1 Tax=Candidatus Nitronereus thalassa TaxID=3020898 RepID=A0ABU3K3G8_9BACT|nr:tRNA 2-thiocytidine(32) synthetase TtcA [Candidatus Nitronereus thalassa]MDT7040937.1 tRNA 2-thiocytidine(32) synthetase TtcA [Candidatus Nitronereus thalassa]